MSEKEPNAKTIDSARDEALAILSDTLSMARAIEEISKAMAVDDEILAAMIPDVVPASEVKTADETKGKAASQKELHALLSAGKAPRTPNDEHRKTNERKTEPQCRP
jgi:hypothetical protein